MYKLFLRSTILEDFSGRRLNDSQYLRRLRRLSEAIFVKMSYDFLFGHKGLTIISQAFYISFAFDSSLSIILYLKSSFELYLVNPKNKT